MPTLSRIPNLNLKIIFLVHFIFIALGSMGFWSSSAYLFYNFILILFIVWGIYHPQREEPIQLAIVVNGVSIFLDILLLIMAFPSGDRPAREKFSAAMCILHLLARPVLTILLVKDLEERTGAAGALTGLFTGGSNQQSSYEDIDRNLPHSSQQANYDFPRAQEI